MGRFPRIGTTSVWLRHFILFCFFLGFATSQGVAQANLLVNGGFESGWSNGIPGWHTSQNVGLASGYSNAAEGTNYVRIYGTLSQDVPTIPGRLYQLRFAMAGNLEYPEQHILSVRWGNHLSTATWDPTGKSSTNLGWSYVTHTLVATGTVMRLSFSNPAPETPAAPSLDAVSLVALDSGISMIDFEPPTTPGGGQLIFSWREHDFLFSTINHFFHQDSGNSAELPANGGAYLRFFEFNRPFTITNTLGRSFSLFSVELAEFSTLFAGPKSVTFAGRRKDGSQVSETFVTDGMIDGSGPKRDFQTFHFSPQFTNLISVSVTNDLYSLDKLTFRMMHPKLGITNQPASQTVYLGSNVTFEVTAVGEPPLSYQWRRNSTNLVAATNHALQISNAQLSHSGTYSVLVTDGTGASLASSDAVLRVRPVPHPDLLWTLSAGERSYLRQGTEQRGLAHNPTTDRLLLVDRISTSSGRIHVLDAATGEDLHALNT
ncbi:MAG: immunoglobulin domain-containing protein, partial [Limisphaerales bacterium]